jgi:hypothetical protein
MTPAERITVYGLFTPKGFCLYVGATNNPKLREGQLRGGKHPKGLRGWRWSFNPLVKCSPAKATQTELDKITHYKRKGQAIFNRNFFGRPAVRANTGFAVRCRTFNLTFLTMQAASQHFGCSLSAVSKAIWNYAGRLSIGQRKRPYILEIVPELSWHPKCKTI